MNFESHTVYLLCRSHGLASKSVWGSAIGLAHSFHNLATKFLPAHDGHLQKAENCFFKSMRRASDHWQRGRESS